MRLWGYETMELELKMQEITCCEMTQCMTISHEEVIETGITEYCPDIARVVDTVGQLKVREKKLSNGHLSIGGVIKVTVLYTSEASSGLRSLVIPVQFACASDDPRLQGCRSICACGRLRLLEARAVTARKLYIRAMAEFEVEGIRGAKHCYCASAGEDPALHLHYHQLHNNYFRLLHRVQKYCLQDPVPYNYTFLQSWKQLFHPVS